MAVDADDDGAVVEACRVPNGSIGQAVGNGSAEVVARPEGTSFRVVDANWSRSM